MEHHFTPWSFQRRIFASKAKYVVVPAGTGTGKTVSIPYWLYDRIVEHPQGEFLVVSADKGTALGTFINKADGLVPVLCDQLGLGEYISSQDVIRLRTGGTIYIRTAENPKLIHGIHANAVVIDEAGFIEDDAGDAALMRADQKQGRYLITGYPQRPDGWYRRLVERGQAGDPLVDVVKVRTIDSPFIDPAVVEEKRANWPAWKFAQMYEGEFNRAMGAVFDPYVVGCVHDDTRDRLLRARKPNQPPPSESEVEAALRARLTMVGGADGGWAVTAGMVGAWDGNTFWWLGGYKVEEQPVAVNAAGFAQIGMTRNMRVFGDPAAHALWQEYRAHGLSISDATKGTGSVEAGLTRMIGMVRNAAKPDAERKPSDERFVVDRCAPGIALLREEWNGYRWLTNPDGEMVLANGRAQTVKEHLGDDLIDATRYAITSSRPAHAAAGPGRVARAPWASARRR